MKARHLVAAVAATIGILAGPAAASANPGPCLNDPVSHGCAALGTGGSSDTYQFSTSDGNLGNNTYSSGIGVNDHVSSLKKGTTMYTRFCGWSGTNASGSVLGSSSSTTTWSNTSSSGVSSVYLRTSSTC